MKPVPLATPYHSQTKTHKTDHQFFIFSLREVYIHPALPESRIESSDKYSFALSHNTVLDKLKILSKLLVESRPRVYPPPHTHTYMHIHHTRLLRLHTHPVALRSIERPSASRRWRVAWAIHRNIVVSMRERASERLTVRAMINESQLPLVPFVSFSLSRSSSIRVPRGADLPLLRLREEREFVWCMSERRTNCSGDERRNGKKRGINKTIYTN